MPDASGGEGPSFTYSQTLSVDLSSSDGGEYGPSDYDYDDDEEAASFSSSLLYDEGCFVSSQAIMCHGGEQQNPFLDASFDDDLSDDDDDDDDGHSSMLSNASLRRSRAYADGTHTSASVDSYCADSLSSDSRRTGSSARQSSQGDDHVSAATTSVLAGAVSSKLLSGLRGGGSSTSPLAAALGSEVVKQLFVTAMVTLAFEATIGHILEFLKIVMQTAPPGVSYADVVRDITSSKGVAGLWDGFVPWGVVQSIFKGAVFGIANSLAKRLLLPLAEKGIIAYPLAYTLAGGIGGGFQGFVLSPTLLLKTRVMTNKVFRENMSMMRTTYLSLVIGFDIVANEGVMALMKGSKVFAIKRICDWASRYFFSDLFEALFQRLKNREELTVGERSLSSLLGGVASTCVTLPLDVLVAKTQDAKKAGIKISPIKLFREELRERGWTGQRRAYMQGFEARLAHVCLTTVGK